MTAQKKIVIARFRKKAKQSTFRIALFLTTRGFRLATARFRRRRTLGQRASLRETPCVNDTERNMQGAEATLLLEVLTNYKFVIAVTLSAFGE